MTASAWPDVESRLRKAVFAYYLATREAVEDFGADVVSEADVWSFAELQAVEVPEILSTGRFVQIFGYCSGEEEHGLEVCVRNGSQLIYVGPVSGKSRREPNSRQTLELCP